MSDKPYNYSKHADPVDIYVGAAMRRIRRDKNMTMKEVADKVGITYQQYQKYESASNRVAASRLVHIADALGVSALELLPSRASVYTNRVAKALKLYRHYSRASQRDRVLIDSILGEVANNIDDV